MVAVAAAQATLRPFVAARSSTRAGQRAVRLVVRAQQAPESKNLASKLSAAAKNPAVLAAVASVVMAMPAHAEAGELFDFNLTMPVMMAEFLALMVFLEKTWFTPVGKVLDERDSALRNKLSMVRDNSSVLAEYQAKAEAILAEARKEAQATIQAAKAEAQAEAAKKLAAVKEKVDKELAVALAALETEQESAMKNLDAQVDKLSADILARILPKGVKVGSY